MGERPSARLEVLRDDGRGRVHEPPHQGTRPAGAGAAQAIPRERAQVGAWAWGRLTRSLYLLAPGIFAGREETKATNKSRLLRRCEVIGAAISTRLLRRVSFEV